MPIDYPWEQDHPFFGKVCIYCATPTLIDTRHIPNSSMFHCSKCGLGQSPPWHDPPDSQQLRLPIEEHFFYIRGEF